MGCRYLEFDVEVRYLTAQFLNDYPQTTCPELERKPNRRYACLLVDTHQGYFICVPFRSRVQHKNGFRFRNSNRSRRTPSGLDYSKIVLVSEMDYVGAPAVVDQDEYKETMQNIRKIVEEACEYIERYVKHVTGEKVLHEREYQRRYGMSSLPYFHDVLGI